MYKLSVKKPDRTWVYIQGRLFESSLHVIQIWFMETAKAMGMDGPEFMKTNQISHLHSTVNLWIFF